MTRTAAEQFMLELVNRARLDPLGEAARFGIALNQGLPAGTLHSGARYVLAPNADLEDAATGHSLWMLANDIFSHTGAGGSDPDVRVTAEGYVGWAVGENISWSGSTGAINLNSIIASQHRSLFLSAGHRENILFDDFYELGIAQEAGVFTSGGTNWNASMVTQNFGSTGTAFFVTGVAYNDSDGDKFYSIGEGVAGVTFAAGAQTATTTAAGGYALSVSVPATAVAVSGTVGATAFSVLLDVSLGNAKLDIVNGTTFYSSADITLVSGLKNLVLLGTATLDATGNAANNRITGNAAANTLAGKSGNDTLVGGAGADKLYGSNGADKLYGNDGHDLLRGGTGQDMLFGADGHDTLYGDAGNDVLSGAAGADSFRFLSGDGQDTVTDFTTADTLVFDDAIWGSVAKTAAQVIADYADLVGGVAVFDFGNGQTVTLSTVTNLATLNGHVTII